MEESLGEALKRKIARTEHECSSTSCMLAPKLLNYGLVSGDCTTSPLASTEKSFWQFVQ